MKTKEAMLLIKKELGDKGKDKRTNVYKALQIIEKIVDNSYSALEDEIDDFMEEFTNDY